RDDMAPDDRSGDDDGWFPAGTRIAARNGSSRKENFAPTRLTTAKPSLSTRATEPLGTDAASIDTSCAFAERLITMIVESPW
ncbi:hypothetical protein ABTE11_22370, partial [Acinetobacter baumannii]